jgi:hypothetical protein
MAMPERRFGNSPPRRNGLKPQQGLLRGPEELEGDVRQRLLDQADLHTHRLALDQADQMLDLEARREASPGELGGWQVEAADDAELQPALDLEDIDEVDHAQAAALAGTSCARRGSR